MLPSLLASQFPEIFLNNGIHMSYMLNWSVISLRGLWQSWVVYRFWEYSLLFGLLRYSVACMPSIDAASTKVSLRLVIRFSPILSFNFLRIFVFPVNSSLFCYFGLLFLFLRLSLSLSPYSSAIIYPPSSTLLCLPIALNNYIIKRCFSQQRQPKKREKHPPSLSPTLFLSHCHPVEISLGMFTACKERHSTVTQTK